MELFLYPVTLFWLAAAFAGLVFFRFRAEEKRRALTRLVLGPAIGSLDAAPGARRRGLRDFLALTALALTAAAAAGPQWGVELAPVMDLKGNIVIAVDTSLSMGARDLKPSRLENARLLLGAIAEQFADYRIGVAAFAGQAYIQCPLTTDQEAITYFATSLSPGMLPAQGTNFAEAISTALGMLARYGGQKVLVLITDGESHSPDLNAALDAAVGQNLKIFTIGIGTPDGELIPMTDSYGNTMEYKKDSKGKTVVSRLDESTLMKIASRTGAAYLRYTGPDEAAQEIRKTIDSLDLEKTRGKGRANFKNRFQWPLVLALTLLLIELTLMEKGWNFSLKIPGFLRRKIFPGAAVLLFACLAPLSAAQPDALGRKGNSAYAKEDWATASEYYLQAAQKAPQDKRFSFNLGTAYYRLEDYASAGEAFEAGAAGDPKLAARAGYNRANAQLRSGDLPGAITGYRGVLRLDPTDENAKFNLQKALEMRRDNKNSCKDPKEDKKDKKKDGEDKKDKKGGGGDEQEKKKQAAQKEAEQRKAEAKEKSRQILEMMKEKEKEAARGNEAAMRALQKNKPPPQPTMEDW